MCQGHYSRNAEISPLLSEALKQPTVYLVLLILFVFLPLSEARDQFDAHLEYPSGNGPFSIAAGDLDGDGDIDLVTGNYSSNNFSVLKNNGNGSFAAPVNYTVSNAPFSVTLADFDSDDDLDVAVICEEDVVFFIAKNYGDGTFFISGSYSHGTSYPKKADAADLDGDEDIDLAICLESNNISVLKNNGDGSFATRVFYSIGGGSGRSWSVVAAHLGDEPIDLAVADFNSNQIAILENDGDATFGAPDRYTVGSSPFHIMAGDFDNDGINDLATASYDADSISVIINNGDATFDPPRDFIVGGEPYSLAGDDFDLDGDMDLVSANHASDNVSFLRNNGAGYFSGAVNFGAGDGPASVCTGDFDGDGDADLAVANDIGDNVSLWFNTANPRTGPLIVVGYSPINLKVTDPLGNYIGKDAQGNLNQTIFNATYTEIVNDSIHIPFPISGDYIIEIITEEGAPPDAIYSVGVRIDGTDQCILVEEAQVPASGMVTSYTYVVEEGWHYINGDADRNGTVNILDIIYLIDYKFKGGEVPDPLGAGDADCNLVVNIIDIIYLIDYKFKNGPEPCTVDRQ